MKLLRVLVVFGSLAIITRAQRPLNTTTNGTNVLTEPFFVPPKQQHPEQRGGGTNFFQSVHESPGIRNKDRSTPPLPNSHLDILIPPFVGGQQPTPESGLPVPNTRLHQKTSNKKRPNKFAQIRNMNLTRSIDKGQDKLPRRFESTPGKKGVVPPEPYVAISPHDVLPEKESGGPSSKGDSINKINQMRRAQDNQHTPSPPSTNHDEIDFDEKLGVKCSFEKPCAWTYDHDVNGSNFEITTGMQLKEMNVTGVMPGPQADHINDANGHFLHLRLNPETGTRILRSPVFGSTRERCYLEVFLHQSSMLGGSIRIVIEPVASKQNSWVPAEILGDDLRKWKYETFDIDRVTNDFQILFEVVPNNLGGQALRGHVSIDNLRLRNCFADSPRKDACSTSQIKCNESRIAVCIENSRICDLVDDCDEAEDESLNCDKIPFGGRCDFEDGWCGWQNSGKAIMEWARWTGSTPTDKTGPEFDHTFQHTNKSGYYMFVNMDQHSQDAEKKELAGFASNAVMNSVLFNPPPPCHSNSSSPYKNTCLARFFVHQYGMNSGSFNVSVVEMKAKENITTTLWWSTKNMGDKWHRIEVLLPNISSKYFMQVEARKGMRIYSDVAIDDFSMSPECFGFNIPLEHLGTYNYWDPRIGIYKKPFVDFADKKFYELSTCDVRGIFGPTPDDCLKAYNNTEISGHVRVSEKPPHKGVQVWKVPNEGYYTFIVKGAGGGLGSGASGSSRGSIVTSVLELHKDEEIQILVGQSGEHACVKSMGIPDPACISMNKKYPDQSKHLNSKLKALTETSFENGGGGGGGGSYVFLLNQVNKAVPLMVAGGGGGLGIGRYLDDQIQQARGFAPEFQDFSGQMSTDSYDVEPSGPGGGWRPKTETALDPRSGASLLEGSRGGHACYNTSGAHGSGGFGGGGGGCDWVGGGGGGYAGGSTSSNFTNGEGGTSFLGLTRSIRQLSFVYPGSNSGHGSVIIIQAIEGCGCDYRCVALDEYRSRVACICPEGLRLKADNFTACEFIEEPSSNQTLVYLLILITTTLAICLIFLFIMLYNRFQRRRQAAMRTKMFHEQEVQLSRLRATADDSALTNFNPSYGCEGILNAGSVDVKSLPQVARESLRLVKALGQGAFGEVYQGLYRHRDGDTVEMPVAVKTLPELSTGQAESDFLMEAGIMAKFNHPNIVHLIGVCFDRHPRFIVLELLAGGDLKNFLREGRNKPERPSSITMKDLVFCAVDVAKGCRYLESRRFIHRDIAARNCLLSTKGPGRVVKIADFGMARDIYRSDYYRKGGKAMLPIKWMPPEAFLDGIFTSKTDVWSFGVLLWEVFSLGLMPYTGLPNRDVMQLVTGGGRLDSPPGSPPAIYRLMNECWNPTPEQRPTFSTLLEHLTACTQDPDVMSAPLPSFFRPASMEQDTTIMRPSSNDDFCLQVPNSSDYLIPLDECRANAERLLSEATGVTIPDTLSTYTLTNSHKMPDTNCWETSFSSKPKLCSNDSMEDRLISLDTPHQTPTTIDPPQPFCNSPVQSLPSNNKPHSNAITLDPAALQQGYANVKMHNPTSAEKIESDMSKFNGNVNNNNTTKDKNANQPFSIQGYGENHSEISC